MEYKLSSVLPAPVTPGETVTAFGVFPSDATVLLGGQLVPSVAVRDGWRFSVPVNAVARELEVELRGSEVSLRGSVSVNPRIDAVALEGLRLRVSGAGWLGAGEVTLRVAGSPVAFTAAGADLVSSLPVSASYGGISVAVEVGKRSSNVLGVLLEAGAISGRVSAPQPAVLVAPLARTQSNTNESLAFLAIGRDAAPTLKVSGALEMRALIGLNATCYRFKSHAEAQSAFERTSSQLPSGVRLEWDAVMNLTDAGGVVSMPAPISPVSSLKVGSARAQGGSLAAPPVPSAEQWFLTVQGIPSAWGVTRGAGVVVAVIDTGVDLTHPDLKPNLLPGYDFVDSDSVPQDIAGHGTHVAGLVAAHGLALGVAPEASILPVRVLRDLSGGSASTVAQGVLWAANLLPELPNPHPAQIINLSLGSSDNSALLETAIVRAQAAGVLVVAAAGNNGGALAYPAALEGVLSVTALAGPAGGNLTYQPSYAARGAGLWITAFGGDSAQDQDRNGIADGIYSTDLTTSGYGLRMGTSMAAPQVAGLAALARSSGTPAVYLRETIGRTATDLGVMGVDAQYGYGLISARAVTGLAPRSYAFALDASSAVRGWSLVQADGSYLIGSLAPGITVRVLIASDDDGDGLAGETGELIAKAGNVTTTARVVSSIGDAALGLSSGADAVRLTVRP